jgi:hypothetical protein
MTRQGPRLLVRVLGSKPAKLLRSIQRWRKAITTMPEQKQGYMAELDEWTQGTILDPLYEAWRAVERAPDGDFEEECQQHLLNVVDGVKKAIREKVLASYRNGQKAPVRPERPPYKQRK